MEKKGTLRHRRRPKGDPNPQKGPLGDPNGHSAVAAGDDIGEGIVLHPIAYGLHPGRFLKAAS